MVWLVTCPVQVEATYPFRQTWAWDSFIYWTVSDSVLNTWAAAVSETTVIPTDILVENTQLPPAKSSGPGKTLFIFPPPACTCSFYLIPGASVVALLCVTWLGQVLEAVEMSWGGRRGERHQMEAAQCPEAPFIREVGDRSGFAGEPVSLLVP